MHIPKEKRKKLDTKSVACIMIGYSKESKAYRLYNPTAKEVVISRDVVFFEAEKGYSLLSDSSTKNDGNFLILSSQEREATHDNLSSNSSAENMSTEADFENNVPSDPEYVPSEELDQDDSESILRRSERQKKAPKGHSDYISYLSICEELSDPATVDEVMKHPSDPATVDEAMKHPDSDKWRDAMKEEYEALIENKTWDLVDLPPDKKPLSCKWVFKTKRDVHGSIVKHKARLVARGCSQRKGIDYEETYSPVVRYTSLRYLLALAAEYDLDIDQLDAVTAFLQGDLSDDIYMMQPESYSISNKVCKLRKSIYGLKQASRIWNLNLDECFIDCGMTQSQADPCIYYKISQSVILIVAVYVDDMILFSNDISVKNDLKTRLMSRFKMKDLGEARFVLGMQITRDRENKKIWLDQELYIKDILKKFKMVDCKPVDTPAVVGEKLTSDMSPHNTEDIRKMSNVPYQEAVGSLLFLAQISRPDISYAVNNVSRFNKNPGSAHWTAVKRIMRYLQGTLNYKLKFDGSPDQRTNIVGYCDADWASDIEERRSVTGYIFLKNGSAISWCTKRQPTIALSTTESEYMALCASTQEALWLRKLTNEIETCVEPTLIYIDNQGAQHLACTGAYHARTKHIDVRHHFLKEKIRDGHLELKYISSEFQLADALTKAVNRGKLAICSMGQGLVF